MKKSESQQAQQELTALIGFRLRKKRTELGLSQNDLAKILGLTYQQIQKMETGQNRISSTQLYILSQNLKVPLSYFFGELKEKEGDMKKLTHSYKKIVQNWNSLTSEQQKTLSDMIIVLAESNKV